MTEICPDEIYKYLRWIWLFFVAQPRCHQRSSRRRSTETRFLFESALEIFKGQGQTENQRHELELQVANVTVGKRFERYCG